MNSDPLVNLQRIGLLDQVPYSPELLQKMLVTARSRLNDAQRNNVSCALNAMQEKSAFMGVSDLPLIKDIELDALASFDLIEKSAPAEQQISSNDDESIEKNTSLQWTHDNSLMLPSSSSYSPFNVRNMHLESKHDTRAVNEAFQVKFAFVLVQNQTRLSFIYSHVAIQLKKKKNNYRKLWFY